MRISDWSSDVCSSDLRGPQQRQLGVEPRPARADLRRVRFAMHAPLATWFPLEMLDGIGDVAPLPIEARRLQRLVENATGWADERRTGEILVVARLFARSEEHTSELQSLMRISYAVFCLKK